MKKHPFQSAFFDPRVLLSFAFCSLGVFLALFALVFYPRESALAQKAETEQATPGRADVVQMVGPVSQDLDLRRLPYVPADTENEGFRLTRHPWLQKQKNEKFDPIRPYRPPEQTVAMPTPLATFPGITSAQSACGCLPPDTHGDVGPNHYIQAVNSRIKIISKAGTELLAPTTYNSFFSALGAATPCGNQNRGDGFVFYDHLANRWVVSDFAFTAFPGTSFYQCIGVSKTGDPVAGGWWLYALQVDPANPSFLGDYPKFGLWPDAYYLSVNLFSNNTTFNGVRVYALPRAAMINGTGAPNPGAVGFTIGPAALGDTYSLVPATFRTGTVPPVGTPEYFMAINSSAVAGTVENKVFTWRFHVDFVTPANSTFGLGAGHTPNGSTTVNGFVDAFTNVGGNISPNGTITTTQYLDTLGDKIMTPLVYHNLGGTESLWAAHSVNNNQNGTGPTAVRWYQFNVTGSVIPAVPAQQQTFNNAADGLWRWMPSIAVDAPGNMAIAYSVSSTTLNPSIRYAGRLVTDSLNSLAQGEAEMTAAAGHQTSSSGRWGDYSALGIDPTDNLTFWHTHEYYSVTTSAGWSTRIGNFKFAAVATPTPAPTPTPTPPALISISGALLYCSNPVPGPVPSVTLTLTGTSGSSTLSDSSGNYAFASLASGGSYTVTPTKAARAPGSAGVNTVDVVAVQRHFLNLGTPLSGCRLTAADVNSDLSVNTVDVIAVQRFFLGLATGIANTGKYQFSPASRSYPGVTSNQTAQNYDTLVFGDVSAPFAERPDGSSGDEVSSTVTAVALPKIAVDQSTSNSVAAVTATAIDRNRRLVGFQGDFTFDERLLTFQNEPVRKAGITDGNWNVSGNVLSGKGPIRTLRISAYSNDFTPLFGTGTLFELRMSKVSKSARSTQLLWAAAPDHFIFIDADLKTQKPASSLPGSVTSRR